MKKSITNHHFFKRNHAIDGWVKLAGPEGRWLGLEYAGKLCFLGYLGADDWSNEGLPEVTTRQDLWERMIRTPKQEDQALWAIQGSDLELVVWEGLLAIPCGEQVSYGELAQRIGKPKAVRAVASAVGRNPLSLLIPCHRVVRANGEVGEYAWGSAIKQRLLLDEKTA